MATLSVEGETQDEIVRKVRRWLASLDEEIEQSIGVVEAIERTSELTKDALTVVAQAAPRPIARTEVFKALTRMGYEATDSTKRAAVAGLDAPADLEPGGDGDSLPRRVQAARTSGLSTIDAAAATQHLAPLRGWARRRRPDRNGPEPPPGHRRGHGRLSFSPAKEDDEWLSWRSASASRPGVPTGSTTSPSCPAGGPATPRMSTSPGRSMPSGSS